jgi:hypothetical protein
MARFDGRILVVALQALLLGCGRESRQPEPAVPAPAVAPQAAPPVAPAPAPAPAPDGKASPKKTPKDVDGTYPWQSGPIASL